MVDIILVVDDPVKFHRDNLRLNSRHYSSLKYLGAKSLASFQERWGARVYFNTLVPYHYGVRDPPPQIWKLHFHSTCQYPPFHFL